MCVFIICVLILGCIPLPSLLTTIKTSQLCIRCVLLCVCLCVECVCLFFTNISSYNYINTVSFNCGFQLLLSSTSDG